VAALVLAVPGLAKVRNEIGRMDPALLVIAVALELASDLSFVLVFRRFFDRIPARDARLLAWTQEGSGALLPAGGAGGFAIAGWLAHLGGVPTRWLVRRSGALFLLVSAVNGLAVIVAAVALGAGAPGPHEFVRAVLPGLLAAAMIFMMLAGPRAVRSRPCAPRWIRGLAGWMAEAKQLAYKQPSWRVLAALGYLGFDMAALALCLKATGATPSFLALILAYNIGYLASVLPVPAGIGVLDAGLAGALVLYGVSPASAGAAVLVYRAIALWMPGLGGLLAYLRLRRRLAKHVPPSSSDGRPGAAPHRAAP
jgi:uncharacterized membrane protein YbhN (UPF0104 family)